MDLRPYLPADRDDCLRLFDSNTPRFFDSGDRRKFEEFLNEQHRSYFAMEHDGAIIGCGGFAIEPDKTAARLVWGMVRADSHKLGLGRYLLLFRLREITKVGGIERVHLDTSQHSAPFYEKQGFKVSRTVKDGYGPGLDRVEMVMKLVVCP
jgi:N-acetylglutamate synthase-like GNAT family acetyltransferase